MTSFSVSSGHGLLGIADAGAFLARLTRVDPMALVRMKSLSGDSGGGEGPAHVALWGRLPWQVLVTRTVAGPGPGDATVAASELLATLAAADAADAGEGDAGEGDAGECGAGQDRAGGDRAGQDRAGGGRAGQDRAGLDRASVGGVSAAGDSAAAANQARGAGLLPARKDVAWRWPLPPSAGRVVETVPAEDLLRVDSAAAGTLRAVMAGRHAGDRIVRDVLLDHIAIVVTDVDGDRLEIPQRLVQAVARMGFLGPSAALVGKAVHVRIAGSWVGLVAPYGTAWLHQVRAFEILSSHIHTNG